MRTSPTPSPNRSHPRARQCSGAMASDFTSPTARCSSPASAVKARRKSKANDVGRALSPTRPAESRSHVRLGIVELFQNPQHKRGEILLHALRGLHHFGVMKFFLEHSRG